MSQKEKEREINYKALQKLPDCHSAFKAFCWTVLSCNCVMLQREHDSEKKKKVCVGKAQENSQKPETEKTSIGDTHSNTSLLTPPSTSPSADLIFPLLPEARGEKRRRAYFSQIQQDEQCVSETFNAPGKSVAQIEVHNKNCVEGEKYLMSVLDLWDYIFLKEKKRKKRTYLSS